jgi:UDP-glucose 4-epimerase
MTAGGPGSGRLLVVGAGSFIARHFLAACQEPVRAVGHHAIDRPDLLEGVGRVMDPDVRLAERVAGREVNYVMLSSRKVYAPSAKSLVETDRAAPQDLYGRHKLAAERALCARLGRRLTILRLANIFGYERGPGRRTFLSLLLDRLARDGQIRFDMSPFTTRDFLPVEACARLLAHIVAAPSGGVLNVGSGIALPTGRLALWVLEGYGRGELVIEAPHEHDAFVLDVAELTRRYGAPCTHEELRTSCLELGRRLASETAQR